ncbi:MAG: hypothetical protein ACRC6V_00640 [Bacteroidales bacterium]
MAEIKIEDLYSKSGVPLQNQVQRNANDIASLKLDVRNTAGTPVLSVAWVQLRTSMWLGHVASDGQLLKRADYPDAWEAIEAGKVPVVSDNDWNTSPSKRGCFTAGDGSTTFRVPDYNGKSDNSLGAMFQRGDGLNSAGVAGEIQGDAIRNIKGRFGVNGGTSSYGLDFTAASTDSGPFLPADQQHSRSIPTNGASWVGSYNRGTMWFDASRTVPTADDNHPVNVTGCWAIKLFGAVQNAGEIDAATLATQLAEAQSKIAILEQRKSTCLVNATGTGAPHETVVSELPVNILHNNRYVLPNPFGINTPVICWAEIFHNNRWAKTGFVYSNGGYGVISHYIQGEGVIIQTGGIALSSAAGETGSGHGSIDVVYSAPCRVFVRKLEA